MEIPFGYQSYVGRVMVSIEKTHEPAILGAQNGALNLANCTATIEYDGRG